MAKKVAVLYGGKSAEREVSIRTGQAVAIALEKKGYIVAKIDTAQDFLTPLQQFSPDVAFIALHGTYGEDGRIQGLLEILDIPHTGCGVLASAITMDKITTKKILVYHNIPTPDFLIFDAADVQLLGLEQIEKNVVGFGLPVVIKAPTQGSTLGIYFVQEPKDLKAALEDTLSFDHQILVERMLQGTEVTASVIGNLQTEVLPLIEIISNTGRYDYQAKYTPGLSEHIVPARISELAAERVKDLALLTYRSLGCKVFARVDFLIVKDEPYVLEVNSIPGMTETSLLPDAAKAAGISFEDLVERIVNLSCN